MHLTRIKNHKLLWDLFFWACANKIYSVLRWEQPMCLDGGIFRGQSDNTRVSGQTLAADGPHQDCLYCPRIPGLSSFPAAVTKGNITRQSMMNAKLRQQRFLHGYENRLLKTIQMIHNLVSSWIPFIWGLTLCSLVKGSWFETGI